MCTLHAGGKYSCGDAKRREVSDKLKIEWRKSKQQVAGRQEWSSYCELDDEFYDSNHSQVLHTVGEIKVCLFC